MNGRELQALRIRHGAFRWSVGFSLFELTVVIVIMGILLAVAINRLLPYIDEAERIGVLTTESQLRSSLLMVAAKRIAGGEAASIVGLNGSNPMSLMLEAPANYAGEIGRDTPVDLPRRSWYFDTTSNHLVYRPGRPLAWLDRERPIESPEFEVVVAYDDTDSNGVFEPYRDELHGVRLNRVAGYNWLEGHFQSHPE